MNAEALANKLRDQSPPLLLRKNGRVAPLVKMPMEELQMLGIAKLHWNEMSFPSLPNYSST